MNLKDMITDGTVVKFRDGRLAVALRDINPKNSHYDYIFYGVSGIENPLYIDKHGIIHLYVYDDNLDVKDDGVLSRYDIMAIAKDNFSFKDIIQIMFGFASEEDICWDWQREEVKEVTMKEVEEQFGCKVKIVKEEN